MQTTTRELKKFYSYVWSFYGTDDPVYPIEGLTKPMIVKATAIYLKRSNSVWWNSKSINTWCDGDSIDRENVRDIILKTFNLSWS